MKANAEDEIYFQFERDFVEKGIRCIPMIVRYKLDACGIKLKLAAWSRMTPSEREQLASANCETTTEILAYREKLYELIVRRTEEAPTEIPVPDNPAWSRTDELPHTILEKLSEQRCQLSLEKWQGLTDLQRFALLKLSYPGHENKNFPRAMKEFGLGGENH